MKIKVKEQRKEKNIKERKECKILKNNHKGITLIALVVTIVVLLILASASIAMLTGDNGILTRAGDAKIETAVGAVKEQIGLYQIEKKMDNKEVTAESLLVEGKVSRTVQLGGEDKYYMYYALKENSFEGMQGLGKGTIASLKDVFLIDDNLNIKYISSNGKEYGDNLNNKVLEDETEIRFSSKAFSEYVSKISGVTEDEMKFKWMKNQTTLVITDPEVDSLEDLIFFPNLVKIELGNANKGIPQITTMDGIENCSKLEQISIYKGPDKDYTVLKDLPNLKVFSKMYGDDYENIIDALKYCKNLENVTIRNWDKEIKTTKRISELGNIKGLTIMNSGITKIEGLENKTNLEVLKLSDNQISKIEGLEKCKNLKYLELVNNQITDITPLAVNDRLKEIFLKGNTGIDGNRNNYTGEKLEKLNKIEKIIEIGGIISLDLDKINLFTNYKKMEMNRQNLTTLEPLEGLTRLRKLDLIGNKLTLEDKKSQNILESMQDLESLNLEGNEITNVTAINHLANLNNLYLRGKENQINLKQIEDIISNLDWLTVSTESLTTISNCNKSKITKLNLIASGLTELPDLSSFTYLIRLSLQQNSSISNFNEVSKITSLKDLSLKNNNLHGKIIDFSKLINLTNLDLSGNTLWSEDLENLKALKNNTNLTIDLSNNSIIDATALLELDSNTKIYLRNNINLSQDSKDKLKAKFGNNVTF